MSLQEKYAQLFAAEAREHLAEVARGLVALEKEPTDQASLDAVFRSVHTIKGMAAAMGYEHVTRLSHNVESVLDELRSGRRRVDAATIDLLLQASDQLEAAVGATLAGREPPEPAVLIERLVHWRMAEPAAPGEPEALPGPVRPAAAARPRPGAPAGGERVRVDVRRLDALLSLIAELATVRAQLRGIATDLGVEALQDAVERAGQLIGEMQEQVVESRLVPIWQIFDRLPRLVRDAARTLRKDVNLEVTGKDLEVDRSLLEAINEPLVHLLRNAVDHGIESPEERERLGKPRAGRIELSARRERSRVIIEVSDDGHGVDREAVIARARSEGLLAGDADPDDQELFRILARPGFSTARVVSAYSGRGVGLDVVEDVVHGLGGSVQLKTRAGEGARFRLELPLSLAILHALIVEVGRETYAIPAAFARESFELEGKDVQHAHGREWVRWREERLPLTRLQRLFAGGSAGAGGANGDGDGALSLVALEFGGRRLAVSVDAFVGEEEIVVRPVTLPRGTVPVFSGCTLRPDGRPALVIDVGSLARRP